jgi:hypothetical protein
MPIEPHNAITLKSHHVGNDPPRSVADYRAALAARFGGRVPSPSELARSENRRLGGMRPNNGSLGNTPMGWAMQIANLPVVTRKTAADAWRLGVTTSTARLAVMEGSGLATRIPGTKPVQWQIHVTRMEAAE